MAGHWQYAMAGVPPERSQTARAPLDILADACSGPGSPVDAQRERVVWLRKEEGSDGAGSAVERQPSP